MKKLMLAMVCAATAAWAGAGTPSINFESYSTDQSINFQQDDAQAGSSEGGVYWATNLSSTANGDAKATVIAVDGLTNKETVEFPGGAHTKGVDIDSSGSVLYRTIKDVNSSSGKTQDIGDGYYIDTLMKFVVSEEETQTLLDSNAKIGVWLRGLENGTTNLIVNAGYWAESGLVATQYVTTASAKADTWYRVTVKALQITSGDYPSEGADPQYGFVVFLNGTALSYTGDAFKTEPTLVTAAQKFYKSGVRQLFPSLVSGDSTGSESLQAVGFAGQGIVDEISLTATAPDFAANDKIFALTYTAGVTAITYNDGTGAKTISDLTGAGTTNLTLAGAATALTVTATYDSANGYFGTVLLDDDGNELSGSAFTLADGMSGTVKAKLERMTIGDTKYENFTAALAAVEAGTKTTIKLSRDYAATLESEGIESVALVTIAAGKDIVLDLNGKSLTTTVLDNEFFNIAATASLQVINSVDTAVTLGGAFTTAKEIPNFYVAGSLTFGAATGSYEITVPGYFAGYPQAGYTLTIYQGKFIASENSTVDEGDEAFTYDNYIADGYRSTKVGDYWVVAAIPAPTTYTLTVGSDATIASVAVTTNSEPATLVEGAVEVEADVNVSVTWTAAEGKLFLDGGATTNMTFAMPAEAKTLAVPATGDAKAKKGTVLFLTLQDALNDDKVAETAITLLADTTVSSALTVSKAETIDMNGFTFTFEDYAQTLDYNVTILNSKATTGGLLNKAQITIAENKVLDCSTLDWGAGGLLSTETPAATTARFIINAGAELKLGSSIAPDAYLTAGFITASAGAKFNADGTLYKMCGDKAWSVNPAAEVDGIPYTTMDAALAGAAQDQTVKLLVGDATFLTADKTMTTKAGTIDLNGLVWAGASTWRFNSQTNVVIKNGEVSYHGWLKAGAKQTTIQVNVPKNVNLTIDNVHFHAQINLVNDAASPDAVLTVNNCIFDNDVNAEGKSEEGLDYYLSFGLVLSNSKFGKMFITGNTLRQGCRCGLAVYTGYGDIYVNGNTFDGTKSCLYGKDTNRLFSAIQILNTGNLYIENNTFRGQYIAEPFCIYNDQNATYNRGVIVLNGNVIENTVPYLWYFYVPEGQTRPENVDVYFGSNTYDPEYTNDQEGRYKDMQTSNAPYTSDINLALPQGVTTLYGWATGENAAMAFCVTNAATAYYTNTLENVAKDDVIVAVPSASADTLPDDFGLKTLMKNQWLVRDPVTSVDIVVDWVDTVEAMHYTIIGSGVTQAVAKAGTVSVAKSASVQFFPTVAAHTLVKVSQKVGEITTEEGANLAFTVNADASNPDASLYFNTEAAVACSNDETEDFGTWSEAYVAGTNGTPIKILTDLRSDRDEIIFNSKGATLTINWNGHAEHVWAQKDYAKAFARKTSSVDGCIDYKSGDPWTLFEDAEFGKTSGATYMICANYTQAGQLKLAANETFAGELITSWATSTTVGSLCEGFVVSKVDGACEIQQTGTAPTFCYTAVPYVAQIGANKYLSLGAAFEALTEDAEVDVLADVTATADDITKIKVDFTLDANGNVVTLADAAMAITNTITFACTGETAEKGFKNYAQITIAEGQTLDLSALSWAQGLIGTTDKTTATFTLNEGATYKQGAATMWDEAQLGIFSAVGGCTLSVTTNGTVGTAGASVTITAKADVPTPTPVDPGKPSDPVVIDPTKMTAQDAADAWVAYNGVKPADDAVAAVVVSDEQKAAYTALFKGKATPTGNANEYTFSAVLSDETTNAVTTAITTGSAKIVEAFSAGGTSAKVATKIGLYYGVGESTAVGGKKVVGDDNWKIGTGEEMDLPFTKSGDARFYQIQCYVEKPAE